MLSLSIIVLALTMLNLEHVVFNLMGGIRAEDRSIHDDSQGVVVMLTMFSIMASPVLLLGYLILVVHTYYETR